jgi:hypothetical protein
MYGRTGHVKSSLRAENPIPAHHEWHNTFSNKGTVVKELKNQGCALVKVVRASFVGMQPLLSLR